jgi:hypothetical protein
MYNNIKVNMPLESHVGLHDFPLTEIIVLQSNNSEKLMGGGSVANDQILNTVTCDPSSTTCFVDAESKVYSDFKIATMPSDYETKYDTIKDFLAKPYLLTQFQWTSASAENANLHFFDIGPLLTSVTAWEAKRRGFELIRGTFNLRVQVNCSPFQAGKLLIHYLPNCADRIAIDSTHLSRYNLDIIQKYQHPHIDLDARDTVAIMSIPYISPTPWFDVKEGAYDWGRVFVDVVCPFKSGASGILNAEVTLFGYWTDVELCAPIVPQSDNSESTTKFSTSKNTERKESTFKISDGLQAVRSAASSLSAIPFLTGTMETLAWVANCASQVASIFGWSKPRLNDAPQIMARQPFRYVGTSDGPDVSQPVALIHNNAIKRSSDYAITRKDEMSLKYLLKVPTYLGRKTWTTALSSGTLLFSQALAPSQAYKQSTKTTGAHVMTYNMGAPLYYLSNAFKYYRGSMSLKIQFAKTIFHSGKLLITFTPSWTAFVAPTVSTSIYSLREIIDVREQSEIELNFPYLLARPYLEQNQPIGTVHVYILNDLRCPETVAQEIDLIYFITAGDDFEYQVPQGDRGDSLFPYTPQSNNAETIISSGIAESAIKSASTMYSQKSIGEHFCSVKQLLNRNSQLQPSVSLTYASTLIAAYPWLCSGVSNNNTTGVLTRYTFYPDAFSIIAPMYNYFRGGARWQVISDAPSNLSMMNIPGFCKDNATDFSTTAAQVALGLNVAPTFTGSPNKTIVPFQTPVPTGSHIGSAFLQVPYYNKFPVSFVQTMNGGTTNYMTADETVPDSSAIFTSPVNFGTTTILERSFADDFQLSFFIGCPPLLISTT